MTEDEIELKKLKESYLATSILAAIVGALGLCAFVAAFVRESSNLGFAAAFISLCGLGIYGHARKDKEKAEKIERKNNDTQ